MPDIGSHSPFRKFVACQFDINEDHAKSVHARHEHHSSEHDSKPVPHREEDDRGVACTELIMRL